VSDKLTRAELSLVAELHAAGGCATLDRHNRMVFAGICHDPGVVLKIVAFGLLEGEDGKLILNEHGRAAAEKVIAGRTREAML